MSKVLIVSPKNKGNTYKVASYLKENSDDMEKALEWMKEKEI
jgi:hypothetical protein